MSSATAAIFLGTCRAAATTLDGNSTATVAARTVNGRIMSLRRHDSPISICVISRCIRSTSAKGAASARKKKRSAQHRVGGRACRKIGSGFVIHPSPHDVFNRRSFTPIPRRSSAGISSRIEISTTLRWTSRASQSGQAYTWPLVRRANRHAISRNHRMLKAARYSGGHPGKQGQHSCCWKTHHLQLMIYFTLQDTR